MVVDLYISTDSTRANSPPARAPWWLVVVSALNLWKETLLFLLIMINSL